MLFITTIGLMLALMPQDHHRVVEVADDVALTTEKTVVIDNFFGHIEVKKNSGNTLTYRVKKTFDAQSENDLEQGISEVQLKVLRRNDSIIFFVDAPFICSKWNGCYNDCNNWNQLNYDFKFDYVVEMPASLALDVSTIDKGDIDINGITGQVQATNVNGDVALKGAQFLTKATTVNGDVTVDYLEVPFSDCEFSTINGSINVHCAKDLNAVVKAKSLHGDLYTDFEFEQLKPQLIRQVAENSTGTTYRLEESFAIEIGRSGPLLNLETLNGNMYLKKL